MLLLQIVECLYIIFYAIFTNDDILDKTSARLQLYIKSNMDNCECWMTLR